VELELVEGVYKAWAPIDKSELPKDLDTMSALRMEMKGKRVPKQPGYLMKLSDSNGYQRNFPDKLPNQQFFDEWKKTSD